MRDILEIVIRGFSVQISPDLDKKEYVIIVEDKVDSGRVGSKRLPIFKHGATGFESTTTDDIFIAVVECIGFIKGVNFDEGEDS